MIYLSTVLVNFIILSLILYVITQDNMTGIIASAAITSIAVMFFPSSWINIRSNKLAI